MTIQMPDGIRSVLVGFSGGSDSTALLHFINANYNIALYAVHINHCIRGAEALRDSMFCEKICGRLNIRLFLKPADVPALAAGTGASLEEAARAARYEIYEEIRAAHDIDKIATAHTCGDNLETVLFNLLRGTGLRGLRGIPPVRGNIIRPIIEWTKKDVLDYCAANNLEYVTDSTNGDVAYTRNYIRHEIVPRLKPVNPSAEITVKNMCRLIEADADYLDAKAAELPPDLTPAELVKLHDSLLSRWLMRKYAACQHDGIACPQGRLGNEHITLLMNALRTGRPVKLSMPGKIEFHTREAAFKKPAAPVKKMEKIILQPGENRIEEANAVIFLARCEKDIKLLTNIYKLSIHKVLNFDRIIGYIYARARENGDRYVSGGMTRNVKKLLCDRRIPQTERGLLPFVCDEAGIVWIPGFEPRDDVKINENETGEKTDPLYIAYCKTGL